MRPNPSTNGTACCRVEGMRFLAIMAVLCMFFSSTAQAAQAPEPAWEPEPALHDTPMVVKKQPTASDAFAKTWRATSLGLLICVPGSVVWYVGLTTDLFGAGGVLLTTVGVSAAYILVPSWLAHRANGGPWGPQLLGSTVGWGALVVGSLTGTALAAIIAFTGANPWGIAASFFGPMIVSLVAASFAPYVGYRIHEKAQSNKPEPKKASWGVTPMYTGESFVPALAVTGRFG